MELTVSRPLRLVVTVFKIHRLVFIHQRFRLNIVVIGLNYFDLKYSSDVVK